MNALFAVEAKRVLAVFGLFFDQYSFAMTLDIDTHQRAMRAIIAA